MQRSSASATAFATRRVAERGGTLPASRWGLLFVAVIVLNGASTHDADAGHTAGPATVTDGRLAAVELYLETTRAALGLPGMAAAIVVGDEVVFLRGFGEVRVGGEPVRPDTPFLIASLSKSLTALALMQHVEEGSVDLDAPVSTYLPEVSPGGDEVMVRDLMHHRSGLTTYVGREPFSGGLGSSLQANVERLGQLFDPSAPFSYSNANYDAMALIVERVSGLSFADYMRDRVFGPLDMLRSDVDAERAAAAGLAQGHYDWLLLGYREHTPWMPPGLAGSHTMFSTAEDLTHLLIAQLNGGAYRGAQVATEQSIRTLHEPRPYGPDTTWGYAGGWNVGPSFPPGLPEGLSEATTLWHDGSSPGYRSVMWLMPDFDLGFVVLANGNSTADESLLPQVAQGVKAILFGLEPREMVVGSDLLTRWGKQLLLLLVMGQVLLAVPTVGTLRRLLRGRRMGRRGGAVFSSATVVDLAALLALLWIIPSVGESPLRVVFGLPDYRLLIASMAVGIAWGMARSVLAAVGVVRQGSARSADAPTEAAATEM
jgi:CubicO group peptidase (beta-lactamase class C family)